MTKTITVTRCLDCPMYSPVNGEYGTPESCDHHDNTALLVTVYPEEYGIPPNCPLLQSPVTYRAERKGE